MTMPTPDNLFDPIALEWIKTRSLLLAKEINKTTLDALRSLLSEGFERGDSISQLTNSIEGYFKESEKYRAEMISRTEVSQAANQGALQRYQDEGFKKVEWLASPNSCEECLPEDGKVYELSESYGMIPKHPNCTCVWSVALEELQ